jgi:hypothetical protein
VLHEAARSLFRVAERAIGYEFHWLASPDVCVFEERPDIGAPVAARIIGRDAALLNKLHAGRFPMPPDQLAEALRSSIIERQLEVGGNGGLSLHDYLSAAKRDI